MPRIVAADDEKACRLIISEWAFEWDAEITICESGRDIVDELIEYSFHLCIMDLMMPDMNGFDATKYIREVLRLRIPIIAITGMKEDNLQEKCIFAGMNDVIQKPCDPKQIEEKIFYWINKGFGPNN